MCSRCRSCFLRRSGLGSVAPSSFHLGIRVRQLASMTDMVVPLTTLLLLIIIMVMMRLSSWLKLWTLSAVCTLTAQCW